MAAKYTEDDVIELGKKGQAFKNPDGSYSYPIADSEDLDNAIHAVGRGNADHDAIRKYIIGRAKALGLSSKIPDNWNADGSMSDAKSEDTEAETRDDSMCTCGNCGMGDHPMTECTDGCTCDNMDERADAALCPTCKGKGTIMAGNRKCPDCNGTGNASESKSDDATVEKNSSNQSGGTWPERKPRHRSTIPAVREMRLQTGTMEVRRFAADELEVRSGKSGNTIEVTGTPIVYNSPYSVTDMFGEFTETMAPGVASKVLHGQSDVRFLFNHDGLPLARTTSGTLSLSDTKDGLNFTAELDSRQQLASDLAIAIERGDVSQMSCGFIVANDTWNDDMTDRTIHRFADLLDVSAVTYPASPTTSISIAERMMMEAPVESRARVRRMWSVSKELRSGRQLTPESAALMMDGLEVLATADEHVENALLPEPDVDPSFRCDRCGKVAPIVQQRKLGGERFCGECWRDDERAAPTTQDAAVLKAITAAHGTTAAALHAQAKDPDNNSDPADKKVMSHLTAAHSELTQALAAQGKDGTPDDNSLPAVGGPDGSQGSGGQGGQGLQDGTGSRARPAATLRLEMDLLELRRR